MRARRNNWTELAEAEQASKHHRLLLVETSSYPAVREKAWPGQIAVHVDFKKETETSHRSVKLLPTE